MSPKSFVWDEAKNALLKRKRRISFEEVAESLAERGPLWIDDHPRPENYPGLEALCCFDRRLCFYRSLSGNGRHDHPQDDLSQSQSDEDLSRIKRVI
jgi:hypothetical protein